MCMPINAVWISLLITAKWFTGTIKWLCVRLCVCVCVCVCVCQTDRQNWSFWPDFQSHPRCQSVLQVRSSLQSSHQVWQSSLHKGTSRMRSLRQDWSTYNSHKQVIYCNEPSPILRASPWSNQVNIWFSLPMSTSTWWTVQWRQAFWAFCIDQEIWKTYIWVFVCVNVTPNSLNKKEWLNLWSQEHMFNDIVFIEHKLNSA